MRSIRFAAVGSELEVLSSPVSLGCAKQIRSGGISTYKAGPVRYEAAVSRAVASTPNKGENSG